MLHIDRTQVTAPPALAEMVEEELPKLEEFFSIPAKNRRQQKYNFPALSRISGLLPALRLLFHGKCAYCERPIEQDEGGGVEHFRPKQNATNLDGQTSIDHYWWLVYEWSNLYHVCWPCNNLKSTRFPVKGPRAEIRASLNEIAGEANLLLDPCVDFPFEHLVFTETGTVAGKTERGEITIGILDLNSEFYVKSRRKELEILRLLLQEISSQIKIGTDEVIRDSLQSLIDNVTDHVDDQRPFAGAKQQFALQWLKDFSLDTYSALVPLYTKLAARTQTVSRQEQARLQRRMESNTSRQESYSVEDNHARAKSTYYSGGKWIERIELRNFRIIGDLELSFPQPQTEQQTWLMLLGENGVGKSSVLQAVALALIGEKHANSLGLDASSFVRREAKSDSGHVRIFMSNLDNPIELQFRRGSSQFTVSPKDPKVLVLGYGATRLLPRFDHVSTELSTFIRVKNLFDPFSPLSDAQEWLTNTKLVSKKQFDQAALVLKDLLILDERSSFIRSKGKVVARFGRDRASLDDLSTGYQSVVAFVIDIMNSLLERWSSAQVAEGIVLLDEIEAHLHPQWKIQIVERLRRAFPRVQFLVTTHDPLCLKGLSDREVTVLEQQQDKGIVARTNIPPIQGLRADQLLTTFLFGLSTTRGTDIERKKRRYADLVGQQEHLSSDELVEFKQLQADLAAIMQVGETPMNRAVEQAVEQVLMSDDVLRSFVQEYASKRSGAVGQGNEVADVVVPLAPPTAQPPLSSASLPTEVLAELRRQLSGGEN